MGETVRGRSAAQRGPAKPGPDLLDEDAGANASGASAKSVPAVKRAAAILWLLAGQSESMSLSQITRAVDIHPSTGLHILRELAAARLVAFDQSGKTYRLGQGIVDLAQAVVRYDDFPELSRPHLQALANEFDVTATAVSMTDEQHVACVAFAMPPNSVSLNVTLGGRVPTMSGAAGRCIAAFGKRSRPALKRSFERVRWQVPFTFTAWMQEVETARRLGYGEDDGIFTRGVTTLAAPVFSPNGDVTRAIGIASISASLDATRRAQIADAITKAAQEVTRRLRE